MVEHFRFLIARGMMKESDDKRDGHETVLQAGDFKGKCYKCGQTGHKANDPICPMYKKKGKNKFKGLCNLCGKKGHKEKDCWEKDENASNTGATCDTTFSDIGMKNMSGNVESTITYGNGSSSKAERKGDLPGIVCNKYGQEEHKVTLKNIKYVPNSKYNLFRVTQRLNKGW